MMRVTTAPVLVVQCVACIFLHVLGVVYSREADVINVARCRSNCLKQFLKDNKDDRVCERSATCLSCWDICKVIFSEPEVWKEPCRNKRICNDGCQAACQFRKSLSKNTPPGYTTSWLFTETPAVTTEARMQKAYMAWHKPTLKSDVPNPGTQSNADFVYVLFARDRFKKKEAFQQILQTSGTSAIIELSSLPYYPEFWLMAVGENGTQAGIRFNASISHNLPYKPDIIEFPGTYESRYGDGAAVVKDDDSTLNLTFDLTVLDGVLSPTITWKNPSVAPSVGNQIVYKLDWYLNNCKCDWPSDHFSRMLYVNSTDQPSITLQDIAFDAEYLVEIQLKSDKYWKGELTFFTPSCPKSAPLNPAKCEIDVAAVKPKIVSKITTPLPRTTLEMLVNDSVAIDVEHLHLDNPFSHGLDWNISNIGMKFDPAINKVIVQLQWTFPFNHTMVTQELVWNNIEHTERVDAGAEKHEYTSSNNVMKYLQLQPFSMYRIFVRAIYTDEHGNEQVVQSRVLEVNTNITDNTPHVFVARLTANDDQQEKDILNGIILGVTVVSSVIIFGIIILFIYKKRQSFRDIIITKTTVAKSNSYKSNVGCKVDYSNQILITSDDWEVDCRQLKFASHIGQGAFGKVVTGYYQDQRVAIKLVRDCAPISYKEDLLAEIALMKRLGSHPNIVSMVGACTLVEPICLVMEYVPYGNLQNFLNLKYTYERCVTTLVHETGIQEKLDYWREMCITNPMKPIDTYAELVDSYGTEYEHYHSKQIQGKQLHMKCCGETRLTVLDSRGSIQFTYTSTTNSCNRRKCRLEGELTIQAGRSPELNYSIMDEHGGINQGVVTPADLLSFARQVAMAMEYLGDKKYVHRDLAARNVLLGYDKIIKVCDFGLSRDVFTDNQYKKLTNGKLPLKWMAIESLRDRIFTTQSDVWSFGILLWEIVTMGASPYPNIALADLYYLLSNSYRMDKPSNCSDELYIIMRQCWLENPADRPNFTDLRVQLELLLTRDRNYLELDNINVPLSTPESSSGSPASDDTKSLLAAQALQPPRKLSKDELTVNVTIHDKSVERLLKRKGDFDAHNITIL